MMTSFWPYLVHPIRLFVLHVVLSGQEIYLITQVIHIVCHNKFIFRITQVENINALEQTKTSFGSSQLLMLL